MASITSSFFENVDAFNWGTGRGPARTLPESLKGIQLGPQWVVEFIDVADEVADNEVANDDGFIKNHIVSRVLFAEPYVHGDQKYDAAMISMELADELFDVIEEEEPGVYFNSDLDSGVDYFPAVFRVKLLAYKDRPKRSLHSIHYTFVKPLTLGELVDCVVQKRMDEFCFLPHADNWKGCGDFIAQYWVLLIEEGMLVNPLSLSPPHNNLLSKALLYGGLN